MERLPAKLIESKLKDKPLAVIMTDIDHFKRVNDEYGHLAGDYILQEFTKTLGLSIRDKKDWIARFGGEEFMVYLSSADNKAATVVAERMRSSIEDRVFTYKDIDIKITASFGVCTTENDTFNYERIIECADKKLYEAKKQGRNKVISKIN